MAHILLDNNREGLCPPLTLQLITSIQPNQRSRDMRISLLFLLLVLLLPASLARATTYSFTVAWTISAGDVPVAGYRLYFSDGTLVRDLADPTATSMNATVDISTTEASFLLVSYSADNIESDPTPPFTINFAAPQTLQAAFTPRTTAGSLTATLDGSPSTGTITTYSWDFGDGSAPEQGLVLLHTFPANGTYTVRLTVTDNTGATSSIQQQVTVSLSATNQPPTADITVSPVLGNAPLTVTLDGSGSSDPENGILEYRWSFGDGTSTTGSAPSVTHQYTSAGTYTATLTVADPQGATDSITSQPIMVTAPPDTVTSPTAVIAASRTSGTAPVSVTFSGAGSSPSSPSATINSYTWSFGDGTAGSGTIVSHTFTQPGTYTVRLTVTDSAGKQATATMTFTAVDKNQADNPAPLIPVYKLLLLH